MKLSELNAVVEKNTLTVTGAAQEKEEDKGKSFLHRGIATRSFERKFSLADHVKVTEASLNDGILTLKLLREIPEESKPKLIAIKDSAGVLLDGKASKKAA